MVLRITALVGAAIAGVATLAAPSSAAAQGRIAARHGDWQIRCERPVGAPSEQCALVQNVEAQDRANVGLTVIFLRTADRQSRILRVLAPLGVLLPSGLGLSIDSDEVGLAGFVRCLPEGCVAEVELDDALMDRFQSGRTATFVIFQTPEEGIGIPISLNGLSEGFAALDEPPPPPGADDPPPAAAGADPAAATGAPAARAPASPVQPAPVLAQADTRSQWDRLVEDDLFPYVAAVVAGIIFLLLIATRLSLRARRRRAAGRRSPAAGEAVRQVRRRGRRRGPPAATADDDANDDTDGEAAGASAGAQEALADAPVDGRRPPRLAAPAAPRHLPGTDVATRERPLRPARGPGASRPGGSPRAPSGPRPPRPS